MTKGYKTIGFWAVVAATVVAGASASGAVGEPSGVATVLTTIASALGAAGYASLRAFSKGHDGKPSWKTTEFWLSGAAALVALVVASGAAPIDGPVAQAIGAASALLAALGYGVRHALPPIAKS